MGYKKPLEIRLQLTTRCNYDCEFCFNKQSLQNLGFGQSGKDLPKETAKKIISKIFEEGIEEVRFTGGEPLLHPNIIELLSLAKKNGLSTTLNTNASLITPEKAKKIAACTDKALISMHSLPLGKKAEAAAKALAKAGCETRAATVLTRQNIQNLEKFHEALLKMPFSQWVLLRQIPNALNKEPVSVQDMQTAVEKIESFNASRAKKDWFLIENAVPFCCFDPKKVGRIALGAIHEDGHSSLFVDANAAIRPSYFFDICLGKAPETPFMQAWKSDFMRRMNALEFIAEPCHKCSHLLKCMSGSRFSALLCSKSLYALDPLAKPLLFPPELKRNK